MRLDVFMTKITLGRSIFGLLALFFMGTGLALMFNPASMLTHMFVGPIESEGGLSSIRAIWGGTIIAIWASVLLGTIKSNTDYILVGFISLLLTLTGRLVSYVVDGSFPELVSTIMPTVIAIILMLIAYKLMRLPAEQ